MSPVPLRDLVEFRDRIVREVERVLGATDGLTEQQLAWRPKAADANSVIVLAAHTVGAAERHVVVHVGGRAASGTRDEEFASPGDLPALRSRWERVRRAIVEVLESLPPGRLDDVLPRSGERTVRGMLIHAVAHAAEHAGQAELTRDLIRAER